MIEDIWQAIGALIVNDTVFLTLLFAAIACLMFALIGALAPGFAWLLYHTRLGRRFLRALDVDVRQ